MKGDAKEFRFVNLQVGNQEYHDEKVIQHLILNKFNGIVCCISWKDNHGKSCA